MHKT